MLSFPHRRSLAAVAAAALALPLACATPAVAQDGAQDDADRPSAEGERPRGERGERGRRGERRQDGEGRPGGDRQDGEGRGGRFGEGRPDGEGRGPGGPGGMTRFLQAMPVLAALDADGDGTLSEAEIKNATAALKTVDKNKDGKIDAEEMRPDFAGMGPGGPGGRPGLGRDGDRPGGDRPERGGMNPSQLVDGMLRSDANNDGVLSGDEISERLQRGMDRIDENKDGKLDRAELEKMVEAMRNRRGGDRPGDGDGDGERGDRPRGDGDRPRGDRPRGDQPRGDGDNDSV